MRKWEVAQHNIHKTQDAKKIEMKIRQTKNKKKINRKYGRAEETLKYSEGTQNKLYEIRFCHSSTLLLS